MVYNKLELLRLFSSEKFVSKSMLIAGMLFFFCQLSSQAQTVNTARSHSLTTLSANQPNVPDTLTIVAVRVEFQTDDNRFTTGDGTYDQGNLSYLQTSDVSIDPLPHDQAYFDAHLQFAKNYFETVSANQIHLRYRILPDIYELPNEMADYSPTGKSFTNEKVADLAEDTWEAVEKQGGFTTSDLDPDKTAFAIFHAGVGRDIELVGTTLDITPQDIPSLYLGQNSLADLLEEPDFDGFPINNGTFRVTNSLILPRTLSRRGEDVTGEEFVLQLSLNGLICASIGSYLGLPDLFNTNTGSSGIGRFGLMDGESFFSYQGLFPPEPSAWEKIYLGWQTPFTISRNMDSPISLPAAALHQNASIAQYNLSAGEYFLVENRHRDPNNNGVTLTIQQPDGSTVTQEFDNRDDAFVDQTEEFTEVLERGVVTDVNNFDWSLPGGLDIGPDETEDTDDDRLLNGGILIWHIDETIINNELQSQSVNADPNRRGVDLEEADGAQDIGRAANSDLSEQARGTAFDFWWSGNNASVITLNDDTLSLYQNRFGQDTHPSNQSNSGAPSYFEFYDFSDTQPIASFRIRSVSQSNIKSVDLPSDSLPDEETYTTTDNNYLASYPLDLSIYTSQADSFLIVPTRESVYAVNLGADSDPIFDFQSGPPQQPYLGSNLIIGGIPTSSPIEINSWQWNGNNWNSSWNIQTDNNWGFLSSLDDQTLHPDFTDEQIDIATGSFQTPLSHSEQRSITLDGNYTTISDEILTLQPGSESYSITVSSDLHYTGALQISTNQTRFSLLTDDDLLIFDPDNFSQPQPIVQNTQIEWPAFADINRDGRMDFIYVNKETGELAARNLNGALLSYFPIQPPEGTSFIGTPLIARTRTNNTNLFITTQDSVNMNIRGYDARGNSIEGFPLFVGAISDQINQPIHPAINQQTLYAVSHKGELKAWKLDDTDEILWGSRYGNGPYNKVTGRLNSDTPQDPNENQQILIGDETYNWPNPANDFTNLRYQTNSSGTVDVKVITASGTVVFEEQYQASGGVPEERRIATDNWSSGLYFAMVTANVNGKTARKMIKIVVIH